VQRDVVQTALKQQVLELEVPAKEQVLAPAVLL
jgi:hypothetical protein